MISHPAVVEVVSDCSLCCIKDTEEQRFWNGCSEKWWCTYPWADRLRRCVPPGRAGGRMRSKCFSPLLGANLGHFRSSFRSAPSTPFSFRFRISFCSQQAEPWRAMAWLQWPVVGLNALANS